MPLEVPLNQMEEVKASSSKAQDFWPISGQPVDLPLHDPAHPEATLEWWYVHGHLHDLAGEEYSLFASFFKFAREGEPESDGKDIRHMYAVTWRITRLGDGDETTVTLLDAVTPAEVIQRLKTATGDRYFRRALSEVVERGEVPLPDRLLSRPARADNDRLYLDYDGNRLESLEGDEYRMVLQDPNSEIGLDLTFSLAKPITRHGDDGFVRGVSAEEMFYYFCPRCRIEGTMRRGPDETRLSGDAWYDHEFGRKEDGSAARPHGSASVAWNWIALQLENGWELTAYDLFDGERDWEPAGNWLVAIDPDGVRHTANFALEPTAWHTSTRTFVRWPTEWRLEVPSLGIALAVSAAVVDQEYQTLLSQPAFWEGRVNASGQMLGEPVSARGFVERSGFESDRGISELLGTVGGVTLGAIDRMLPAVLDEKDLVRLVARPGFPAHTKGMDPGRVHDLILAPIRHVVALGGKAWRSYALLACVDLVGGESGKFEDWLALPELIHVGSLMVDDVQDRSTLRRGGEPAHVIWGEPLALNSGSAAYFLSHHLIETAGLDAARKVRIYETFFHTMRAAHVGQAFDIAGHRDALREAERTGDAGAVMDQLLLTHRLKSGVPAGNLARIGAILGDGTREQEDGLGEYFEALGIAFQIVDDVIDIRGTGGLKRRGGDLLEGKVTAPLILALPRLESTDRKAIVELLLKDERTQEEVDWMIARMEACGALTDAQEAADRMLEEAWTRLEGTVETSFTLINLRAFSWYLLDRQY